MKISEIISSSGKCLSFEFFPPNTPAGEEKLFDPEGVNPALPEDSRTPVRFTQGEHEILVALGSNNLKAWGIFLRLARTDVDPQMLSKGPLAYAVPEVVG